MTNFNFASYKGFGWNSFQKSWQSKVDRATRLVNNDNPLFDLNNISKHKKPFEESFNVLGLQSKEVLLKIALMYDGQFKLMIDDYVGTSDYIKVFNFLEDLPLYLIEAMEELKKQENEEAIILKEPPPKIVTKTKYKQEEKYQLTNKLGEPQLIFFGRRHLIYGS